MVNELILQMADNTPRWVSHGQEVYSKHLRERSTPPAHGTFILVLIEEDFAR